MAAGGSALANPEGPREAPSALQVCLNGLGLHRTVTDLCIFGLGTPAPHPPREAPASPGARFSMFGGARGADAAAVDDIAVDADDVESQLHEFWSECIVPNWATFTQAIEESRVSFGINGSIFCRLWREGLPERARQLLWPLALGNEHKVTEELFEICCRQSRATGGGMESSSLWQLSSSLMSSLELDIQRTVDESHLSGVLRRRPNMKRDMLMVLEAFAQYRCARPGTGPAAGVPPMGRVRPVAARLG